ncbi:Lipoprotein signal peptidase [Rhodobacteraceae bacterium THAF1]|uniref:signal peptidase II n=1 Tax=Palleronia sp. THAF1 TaxID=2587842 RepID=UPI000F3AB6FE|nr:signal peptidase II [Palleronia sp. THAF1]QFU07229.1 Lipoprotein signal peptidase [Palleronia sp. THAF1]VDC20876.1 Lipoprotein signal peptidase [Rhodobacteraceae bacterium THAF1]
MTSMNSPRALGLTSAITAIIADQATKAVVVANADALGSEIAVFPGFNLVFGRNDGVTFGMLGGTPWWGLSLLASSICLWLAIMLYRSDSRIEALAYGAIIGGALGNVIDRVRFGGVTDFLDFYAGQMHWPAFNLADVFVVCGVALLLLASVFERHGNSSRVGQE